jgi:hypothetical protein
MFIIERFNVTDNINSYLDLEDLEKLLKNHYDVQITKIESKKHFLILQRQQDFSIYVQDLHDAYKEDLMECLKKYNVTKINKDSVDSKIEKYMSDFRKKTYDLYDKYYPPVHPK